MIHQNGELRLQMSGHCGLHHLFQCTKSNESNCGWWSRNKTIDSLNKVGWSGRIIPYWLHESLQFVMWARSMTLAIRTLKCWVNAILPIMFIKEMNKLVTLRMKQDQKADLEADAQPSSLLLHAVFASRKPELHTVHEWHRIYKSVNECVHEWSCKCQGVCEALWCGCFISRWLIVPLPPSGVRGGSGTAALRWTDCVTGQGGTNRQDGDALHETTVKTAGEREWTSMMNVCVTAMTALILSPNDFLIIPINLDERKPNSGFVFAAKTCYNPILL